ncbi:NADH-quinone oxidoreductase subunit C [Streptomyces sp. NPDC051320]|uniref:NADH-quinone oxidoreductase subunit C n=1 Tax=Streptomyces sp. NPDC051320 TaxID=3154644 RepID=UPI0034321032
MNAYDRLPEAVTELFGEEATADHSYDLLTVDVPAASWIAALETARNTLGCTYFDWLSAVDEPDTGFRVCAHVVALDGRTVRRLLVRTTVPHTAPELPTAVAVYAGASWHERETHEMFGVSFTDHPHLTPLLLPEGFEGHPLRKDFVLAARVVKAWPGAKEPGESTASHGGAKRRQMLPPGVPDPNEWGPQKGQLPPAPARPARTPRAAGDRPVRRARSVSEGSASQAAETAGAAEAAVAAERKTPHTKAPEPQATEPQAPEPKASEPKASGAVGDVPATGSTPATGSAPDTDTGGTGAPEAPAPARPVRSEDAPWHHARPASGATDDAPRPADTDAGTDMDAATDTGTAETAEAAPAPAPAPAPDAEPRPNAEPRPEDQPGPDTPAGGDTA